MTRTLRRQRGGGPRVTRQTLWVIYDAITYVMTAVALYLYAAAMVESHQQYLSLALLLTPAVGALWLGWWLRRHPTDPPGPGSTPPASRG